MVCGNMEVEASRASYIDNLYDSHEDKVFEYGKVDCEKMFYASG